MANVIALPFKFTREVPHSSLDTPTPAEPQLSAQVPSLASSLVQLICDNDPTVHPDAVQPDADGLASQRYTLFKDGTQPLEVGDKCLLNLTAYYAQLSYALTKLPAEILVSVTWLPIFASSTTSSLTLGGFPSSTPISIPNLQFERLAVLYNVAAMHAAIGAQSTRSDEEGIKSSIAAFQKAAGVLAHLLDLLPDFQPDPPAMVPPSPDLSSKVIEALRDICLAQAQEAFWQKAVMDRLKNGTIAKLAAKVSEFYEAAAKEALEAKGSSDTWPSFTFPLGLINHLNIKHLHFAAVAQFRKSIDDLGANRYGDELGRLRVAEGYVKKAMDGPRKGVAESVSRDLKGLHQTLMENLARADKDNHLIYLEAATPLSSLPPIISAAMVRPTPPPTITSPLSHLHSGVGGLGRPFFETLVPQKVTSAVRVWKDRLQEWVKEEVSVKSEDLDKNATKCLEEMGLPGSIQAVTMPVGLPPSLLAKAQEVREGGGSERIRTMMRDVRRVAKIDRDILDEALSVLAQEASSDDQYRAQYGTDRWTRPASAVANAHLSSRAESLSATLSAAGSSDAVVRAKFGEWENDIYLLGSDEKQLEASIPALAAPSLTSKQSSTLTDLRNALQVLDELRASRRRIVKDAKYAVEQDDIRPDILRKSAQLHGQGEGSGGLAQFEDLFDERLGGYRRFRERMSESESRQEDALDRIKVRDFHSHQCFALMWQVAYSGTPAQTTNAAFLVSRRNDAVLKSREAKLQALDAAYHKFLELRTNLQEGLKFYSDVAGLLNELRDSCKEWAYSRNMESRDQLQGIQEGMEAMRLKVARPGVFDPTKDGPIRFG
ncbi:programmed cell death 6-interacting protein, partial [Phenoliferia sp. Uapishka_3]